MNYVRLLPVLALSFGAVLGSCGTDNGGKQDAGNGGADMGAGCSVEANFTSLHDNLFSSITCSNQACHVDATEASNDGLNFSKGADAVYNELTVEATGSAAGSAMFPMRVASGDAANSYLMHKLTADPPIDGSRMPVGPPLMQCQIDAIQSWINAGAPR